jgi:hypothetical protein
VTIIVEDSSGAGGGAGSRNDASAQCSALSTGNACVDCCIGKYRSGVRYLSTYSCVCAQCDAACKAMVCPGGDMHPQTPCIACVQDSLRNVCPNSPGWRDPLATQLSEYVDCVLACPIR